MSPQLEALAMLNNMFQSFDGRPVDNAVLTRKDYAFLVQALTARVPFALASETPYRWIPVGERLPDSSGYYHVWTNGPHDPLHRAGTCTAYFYSVPPTGWRLMTGEGDITHWMPLPKEPK